MSSTVAGIRGWTRHYHRLLVVGGTPTTQAALTESLGSPLLEIRCIDGTQGTRSAYTVEADLDWADVLVTWATTPLPHKISLPYPLQLSYRLMVQLRGSASGSANWPATARISSSAVMTTIRRSSARAT